MDVGGDRGFGLYPIDIWLRLGAEPASARGVHTPLRELSITFFTSGSDCDPLGFFG